jgi:hypothetical protein
VVVKKIITVVFDIVPDLVCAIVAVIPHVVAIVLPILAIGFSPGLAIFARTVQIVPALILILLKVVKSILSLVGPIVPKILTIIDGLLPFVSSVLAPLVPVRAVFAKRKTLLPIPRAEAFTKPLVLDICGQLTWPRPRCESCFTQASGTTGTRIEIEEIAQLPIAWPVGKTLAGTGPNGLGRGSLAKTTARWALRTVNT